MTDIDRAIHLLEGAGWFEGRDVSRKLADWRTRLREHGFEPSLAAERALREFGGIRVHQRAPGVNLARESFDLDPLLALGQRDRFKRYETTLGLSLYPFGEWADGALFLAIASDGRVFAIGDDEINLVGGTAKEAILNLIRGVRGASIEGSP
jgi:SUKH-3 immunity protein of toxin-antitoxin system